MKKLRFAGCLTLGLFMTLSGYASSQDKIKAPRLALSEEVYDFGEVREGERIAHDFIVRNSGSVPLEIKKVSPG
ncbi:MAG: DUF1573 domain-containing protein [Deltaproteobacteria bacterium]|nr:DUF1573 domain-containing protein [Deltaproteobacteria bacterium]